jgi:hypothetical protein
MALENSKRNLISTSTIQLERLIKPVMLGVLYPGLSSGLLLCPQLFIHGRSELYVDWMPVLLLWLNKHF